MHRLFWKAVFTLQRQLQRYWAEINAWPDIVINRVVAAVSNIRVAFLHNVWQKWKEGACLTSGPVS